MVYPPSLYILSIYIYMYVYMFYPFSLYICVSIDMYRYVYIYIHTDISPSTSSGGRPWFRCPRCFYGLVLHGKQGPTLRDSSVPWRAYYFGNWGAKDGHGISSTIKKGSRLSLSSSKKLGSWKRATHLRLCTRIQFRPSQ